MAAGLMNPPEGTPGPGTARAVEELVQLASDAAVDLDNLDVSLEILERQTSDAAIDASLVEAIALASGTQALLVRRFEEALASLGRLQVATVDAPRRLAELAEQLARDADRRAEAREVVRRLTT